MDTGVARKPIAGHGRLSRGPGPRLDPTAGFLQKISGAVQRPAASAIVFAEGEEPSVIRAAYAFQSQGLGARRCWSVARTWWPRTCAPRGSTPSEAKLEMLNARVSRHNAEFVDFLYARLQREGYLRRDVQRLINQDRNSFAACHGGAGLRRRHGDRRHPQLTTRRWRRSCG